jgi:hypothetical protein
VVNGIAQRMPQFCLKLPSLDWSYKWHESLLGQDTTGHLTPLTGPQVVHAGMVERILFGYKYNTLSY